MMFLVNFSLSKRAGGHSRVLVQSDDSGTSLPIVR